MKIQSKHTKAIIQHMRDCWGYTLNPDDYPLGMEITRIRSDFTRKQQNGHWLLLGEWLRQKPMPGVNADDLHKWCCCKHFGYFESELPDGRIDWMPVRTTTKVWDDGCYVAKKLPKEQYSEYIDFIYRTAAEGSVVLPELKEAA